MSDNKPDKASEAQFVDAHDGIMGKEKQAASLSFVQRMLEVYLPHRNASTYARHKPLRALLKAYRIYHRLDPSDRRHQMAANLRQVFQSHPNDVSIRGRESDMTDKTFAIVDGFLAMVDDLYAGIRSLLSRHENELVYAYDLALDLKLPGARVEHDKNVAKALAASVSALQNTVHSTDEQKAKLMADKRKLNGVLQSLEKGGEKDLVAQIRAELQNGGK
jgi:hypothetical protein